MTELNIMEQIHECEKKIGKIIDLLIDRDGNLYCKSCRELLPDKQIDPIELIKINKTYRQREAKKWEKI